MRFRWLSVFTMLVLGLSLAACGDDTGGGGGGDDGGSDDGGSDDGGSDDGGSDDGGDDDGPSGGGGITTCAEVCAQADVSTPQEGICVYEFMLAAGYPIAGASSCQGVTSEENCNDCWAEIEPTDADCAAAYVQCNE